MMKRLCRKDGVKPLNCCLPYDTQGGYLGKQSIKQQRSAHNEEKDGNQK